MPPRWFRTTWLKRSRPCADSAAAAMRNAVLEQRCSRGLSPSIGLTLSRARHSGRCGREPGCCARRYPGMTDRIIYPPADKFRDCGMPPLEGDGLLDAALDCRIAVLTEGLEDHGASSREELDSLDPELREELFWQRGYLVGLRCGQSCTERRPRAS